MDEAKAARIVGKPDGWTPKRDSDHFMLCPVCGEMIDMRRLDQALAHWHDGGMDTFDSKTRCNECDGRGSFAGKPCRSCGGKGHHLIDDGEKPKPRMDRPARKKPRHPEG